MILVPFFTLYGLKQGRDNDRLIAKLEADPELAKTHHRTTFPFQKKWPKLVHVWPYLLRIEFLVALILTVVLVVWSIVLNAPLEEPANPNLTMNPSKAPWYFLGLQEMLVYFDPWIAGVILPNLILVGLMAIPYCDTSPLGNGYYTIKQRKYALGVFFVGFHCLWISMTVIGVFIRGPGWMWFWPGMTWDHTRVIYETNRNLNVVFQIPDMARGEIGLATLFGGVVVTLYFVLGTGLIHKLYTRFKPDSYAKMNIIQYSTMIMLLLTGASLPLKMILRLIFRIKYVWVTPWFNI